MHGLKPPDDPSWYYCEKCDGPVEDGECQECGHVQATYQDMLASSSDFAYERWREKSLGWDD